MWRELLIVALGGAVGSSLRYLFTYKFLYEWSLWGISLKTFCVNVIGSLLIGFLIATVRDSHLWALLVVGLCGGFTTFSTFSAETLLYINRGEYLSGLLYAAGSVVLCVAFAALGAWFAGVAKG